MTITIRTRQCPQNNEIAIDEVAVPKKAYEGRSDFTRATFSEGLKDIGHCAFRGCSSILGSMNLPKSLKRIGSYAFCDCRGVESICLQDGLAEIMDCAFLGCFSLTEIEIPASVNYLGGQIFKRCICLREVRILGDPEIIGKNLFSECNKLERILLSSGDTAKFRVVIPEYMELMEARDGWKQVYERKPEPLAAIDPGENEEVDCQRVQEVGSAKAKANQRPPTKRSVENGKGARYAISKAKFVLSNALEDVFRMIDKEEEKDRKKYEKSLKTAEDTKIENLKLCEMNEKLTAEKNQLLQIRAAASVTSRTQHVLDEGLDTRFKDLGGKYVQLRNERDELKKDNGELRNDNSELRKDNAELRKDHAELRQRLKTLEKEKDINGIEQLVAKMRGPSGSVLAGDLEQTQAKAPQATTENVESKHGVDFTREDEQDKSEVSRGSSLPLLKRKLTTSHRCEDEIPEIRQLKKQKKKNEDALRETMKNILSSL